MDISQTRRHRREPRYENRGNAPKKLNQTKQSNEYGYGYKDIKKSLGVNENEYFTIGNENWAWERQALNVRHFQNTDQTSRQDNE